MEMTNKGRTQDLEAIRRIAPDIYELLKDEGLHGHCDDEKLHLTKAQLTIWEKRLKE